MCFHTIINENDVFSDITKPIKTVYKQIGNRFVQLNIIGSTSRILRIESTNPKDYLDTKYQIGEEYKL